MKTAYVKRGYSYLIPIIQFKFVQNGSEWVSGGGDVFG